MVTTYTGCRHCAESILRAGPDTLWQHVTETGTAVECAFGGTTAEPAEEIPRTAEDVEAGA